MRPLILTPRQLGQLAAWLLIATCTALTTLVILGATEHCHGYLVYGQRGGVTHYQPICRLR